MARQNIITTYDFETLADLHVEEKFNPDGITLVSGISNEGKCLKAMLRANKDERSEVAFKQPLEEKRWYGFKVKPLPGTENSGEVVNFFQMTGTPAPGKPWAGAYQLRMSGGNFKFRRFPGSTAGISADVNMGAVDPSKFTSIVIEYYPSTSSRGLVRVYVNGVVKYDYTGKTLTDGQFATGWLKTGNYIGVGNTASKELTVYVDSLRIGNSNATYADVAP